MTKRVGRSEESAAAARVLAGGADRDVEQIRAEFRDYKQATTSGFNAMREDITDLRTDLNDLRTKVDEGFAKVDQEFAKVDRGFTEMRGKLDGAAAGQQQIVDMLSTLIDQRDGQS
ncbi:MAG: permease [Sciscionella sp.]|nr:permease [Sciscionella sp.]